jgi:hypothetical protein
MRKRAAPPDDDSRKRAEPPRETRDVWVSRYEPHSDPARLGYVKPGVRAINRFAPSNALQCLTRCPAEFGKRDAAALLEVHRMLTLRSLVHVRGCEPMSMIEYCERVLATPTPPLPADAWSLVLRHLPDRVDRRAFGATCRRMCMVWRASIHSMRCTAYRRPRQSAVEPIMRVPRLTEFNIVPATGIYESLYNLMAMTDRAHCRDNCRVALGPSLVNRFEGHRELWCGLLESVAVVDVDSMLLLRTLVAAANVIPPTQHCAALSIRGTSDCYDKREEFTRVLVDDGWFSVLPFSVLTPLHASGTRAKRIKWRTERPDHAYPRRTLYMSRVALAIHQAKAAVIDAGPRRLHWWHVLDVQPDPREPPAPPPMPDPEESTDVSPDGESSDSASTDHASDDETSRDSR